MSNPTIDEMIDALIEDMDNWDSLEIYELAAEAREKQLRELNFHDIAVLYAKERGIF